LVPRRACADRFARSRGRRRAEPTRSSSLPNHERLRRP
jgi:hypothetical protein